MIDKILFLEKDDFNEWQDKFTSYVPQIITIIFQLTIGIAAGFVFNWLQIPVGWLLGSMIGGMVYSSIRGNPQPLPKIFISFGKAFIALGTAVRFSWETINFAATYAVPLLLCVLISGSLSLFHGYLLSRWSGIDKVTGFVAFIPGVASSIVPIAEEMGADAVAVALFQYLRLLIVVLLIPSAAGLFFPADLNNSVTTAIAMTTANNHSFPMWLNLAILGLCCVVGMWGGNRLNLPASGFLGTLLVALGVFWSLPDQLQVPQWLFAMGLLFVGISIGFKFDIKTANKLLKAVLIQIALVVSLIILCLGVGYSFHVFTQVDTITSLLGFTPGGLEAMVATVMQLGGDTGLVLAMQLTRMLIIIAFGPWLVTFVIKVAKD
ncbi:AbrB family transcriptional regulator [Plectonema cf. radiosum LEGE 06105]|uniref:AbrB family transcriptional regulator n=1 Tax=Plectonema cf. radiosum LEGE 06105 TaxID=945769 RepID=A0A8J7K3H6_9CYAN|nr:AbrB family transcriptional regulator [Plectonema radiosum]MBE9214167.1 AbrB family transcriptional regulator [Plectonema cf. radiosum LEGE 06105]